MRTDGNAGSLCGVRRQVGKMPSVSAGGILGSDRFGVALDLPSGDPISHPYDVELTVAGSVWLLRFTDRTTRR